MGFYSNYSAYLEIEAGRLGYPITNEEINMLARRLTERIIPLEEDKQFDQITSFYIDLIKALEKNEVDPVHVLDMTDLWEKFQYGEEATHAEVFDIPDDLPAEEIKQQLLNAFYEYKYDDVEYQMAKYLSIPYYDTDTLARSITHDVHETLTKYISDKVIEYAESKGITAIPDYSNISESAYITLLLDDIPAPEGVYSMYTAGEVAKNLGLELNYYDEDTNTLGLVATIRVSFHEKPPYYKQETIDINPMGNGYNDAIELINTMASLV